MKSLGVSVIAIISVSAAAAAWAGGEPSAPRTPTRLPGLSARPIERSALRGPVLIPRDPPPSAPYRPVCWGYNCNEFYGPTYYYPSDKLYEGNHPQYYPFFHPIRWPNYKAAPPATCPGGQCGPSRSLYFWDSYDDWMRGARYEEHQL